MATKPVKSTDPRKKSLLALFKAVSGGNKITSVKEHADGATSYFTATCLKGKRSGYSNLGTFRVEAADALMQTTSTAGATTANLEEQA